MAEILFSLRLKLIIKAAHTPLCQVRVCEAYPEPWRCSSRVWRCVLVLAAEGHSGSRVPAPLLSLPPSSTPWPWPKKEQVQNSSYAASVLKDRAEKNPSELKKKNNNK